MTTRTTPEQLYVSPSVQLRAVAGGEIVTVEYLWRHASGDWEWVETTAQEIQCSTRGAGERRAAFTRQSVVARLGNLVMQRRPVEEAFDEAVRVADNVPPADFIPVAVESGLVIPLGARVLRAACEQVARCQESHPGLRLTVNVSARQMAAPDFVETGLHPDSLGLEITERLLLEETPGTALTIELLQALGVRLLLDDFGTGYSSLRYLQRYPLDGLKVDRACDGATVGMARALGMGVIPADQLEGLL